ncbi:endolytic transglycosylase MltG, partial [Patulibacter medicamentivorans]|uniref:endolytic transglycosylase MltG n=1 Tax=Patulibacter medicamentivorans TaxID=1097667 RepID=UPI00058FB4F7
FDHDPPPSSRPARRAAAAAGKPPATVVGQRTAPARRGVSRIAALLVLIVIALLLVAAYVVFEPFKGDGSGRVAVVIPPGSSVDDIGKLLEKKGVISHAAVFSLRARISGAGGALRAGTVEMKHDMSYGAAIDALQKDPLPPPVIRVSIPEGLSRRETAAVVRKAGIRGDYLSASARSRDFDPRRYGQPRRIKGLEGFLFPATYELQRGTATASSLVAEQVASFRKQIGSVSMRRARKAKLTRYDVLIIASMIEREVRVPAERRLVAAVIYNRLRTDMFLGIDATIRYAERNWSRPLRQSELDRPGPYNTRRTKGLPPTPIGNPGLASIQAAANPARSNAVYYVVRPCGNGRHNFSATAEGFARDQAYYEQERKRVGGDPADATGCKRR